MGSVSKFLSPNCNPDFRHETAKCNNPATGSRMFRTTECFDNYFIATWHILVRTKKPYTRPCMRKGT